MPTAGIIFAVAQAGSSDNGGRKISVAMLY